MFFAEESDQKTKRRFLKRQRIKFNYLVGENTSGSLTKFRCAECIYTISEEGEEEEVEEANICAL